MQCDDYEKQLIDYEQGTLLPLEKSALEEHLGHCDVCAAQRAWLFEVNLMSSRWTDQSVPDWDRTRMLPKGRTGAAAGNANVIQFRWPQLLASAASVVVVTLVMVQLFLVNNIHADGYVSEASLDTRLQDWSIQQENRLAEAVYTLTERQNEANEWMLTSLLETSRQERRQDLNTLAAVWSRHQEQQVNATGKGIRYLMAKQQEDDRELAQLRQAINTEGGQY